MRCRKQREDPDQPNQPGENQPGQGRGEASRDPLESKVWGCGHMHWGQPVFVQHLAITQLAALADAPVCPGQEGPICKGRRKCLPWAVSGICS